MWKPLLGSKQYEINCESGNVRTISSQQDVGGDDQEKIDLVLEGRSLKLNRAWTKYMSYFEYTLEKALVLQTETNPSFYTVDARIVKYNHNIRLYFKQPVYITERHRLVPNYPQYAIDEYGEIIDVTTLEVVVFESLHPERYITAWIYDPDRGFKRSIAIHRLVADAWVYNSDVNNRCIVNHLDGNKHNPHKDNLEWCTVSENNLHAIDNGLSGFSLTVRVRDIIENKVHQFSKWKDARIFMGIPVGSSITKQRHISIPYRGRYEIRIGSDDRDWYFEYKTPNKNNGRYIVEVFDTINKKRIEFRDTRDFKQSYSLWNISGLRAMVTTLRQRQPHLVVNITDTFNFGGVQMMDFNTGDISSFESSRDASRKTGFEYTRIQNIINKGGYLAFNGVAFRRETTIPWKKEDNVIMKNSARTITAVKEDDVKEFRSLTQAAKTFGVDRSVIKHRIRTATLLNGYLFSYESPLLS